MVQVLLMKFASYRRYLVIEYCQRTCVLAGGLQQIGVKMCGSLLGPSCRDQLTWRSQICKILSGATCAWQTILAKYLS